MSSRRRGEVAEALVQAQAMLEPLQQKLPDPLEAALEAAIQAGENNQPQEARKHLEQAVKLAQETGFL